MQEDSNFLKDDIPIEIGGGKNVLESMPEVIKWFNDPDVKNLDPRFTKDIILSNLNAEEVARLRDMIEFTRQIAIYPILRKAKLHFVATSFDIPITANAKGGFARKISHTSRQEASFEDRRPEKRSFLGFGKK